MFWKTIVQIIDVKQSCVQFGCLAVHVVRLLWTKINYIPKSLSLHIYHQKDLMGITHIYDSYA